MTTYAKYYKQNYPVGNAFNQKDQKLVEAAQSGIGDENTLRLAILQADANDLIVLAPTTITLTSPLVVNKPLRIKGSSWGGTTLTASAAVTSAMFAIDMTAAGGAALASVCTVGFENLNIQHTVATTAAITANNTNMGAAFHLRFVNCSVQVLAATAANAITVTHTTAGHAVHLHIVGTHLNLVDAINFSVKNAADRITVEGVSLAKQGQTSAVITSADNLAAQIKLFNCQVPALTGASGGHAGQLLISNKTISLTGTTYAVAVVGDYVGSHTQTRI